MASPVSLWVRPQRHLDTTPGAESVSARVFYQYDRFAEELGKTLGTTVLLVERPPEEAPSSGLVLARLDLSSFQPEEPRACGASRRALPAEREQRAGHRGLGVIAPLRGRAGRSLQCVDAALEEALRIRGRAPRLSRLRSRRISPRVTTWTSLLLLFTRASLASRCRRRSPRRSHSSLRVRRRSGRDLMLGATRPGTGRVALHSVTRRSQSSSHAARRLTPQKVLPGGRRPALR